MSIITTRQVQALQIARRQVEKKSDGVFDEAAFRVALRNTAKVKPDAEAASRRRPSTRPASRR